MSQAVTKNAVIARAVLAYNRLKQGWCQGDERGEKGNCKVGYNYCLIGSTMKPGTKDFEYDGVAIKLRTEMSKIIREDYNLGIAGYNDANTTTKKDVLSFMEKLLKHLRSNKFKVK